MKLNKHNGVRDLLGLAIALYKLLEAELLGQRRVFRRRIISRSRPRCDNVFGDAPIAKPFRPP